MEKNTIRFDYVDNPDLRELFSAKQPGDTMSVEMVLTVSEVNSEYAVARLDEISGELEDGQESEPMSPGEDEPVAIVVMRKNSGLKPRTETPS